MSYYSKIALLTLNADKTKLLVVANSETSHFLMPGGQIEQGETDLECLHREIREELDCDIDETSLQFIGEYSGFSATNPDRDVDIKLYLGNLIGDPVPSSEIKFLEWIGVADSENELVSPIIHHQIIPDLLEKGLLKN